MVRVLIVVPSLGCPAERAQMLDTVTRLSEDHCVRVCLLSPQQELSDHFSRHRIECSVISRRGPLDINAWLRVHRHFSSGTADVIHLWDGAAQLENWAIAFLSGRPIVSHLNSRTINGNRFLELSIRWFSKYCQTVSTGWDSIQTTDLGDMPRGLDSTVMEMVDAGTGPQPEWFERLSIPEGARKIGVASHFVCGSGIKDAVWATDLLKNIRDDVHLILAGGGPLEWRLRRYIRQCRIEDRVHLVGRVPASELTALVNGFWLPAHRAANPYIAMRAMARGVPVIATDLPENQRLFQHEVTGLIYPVGSRRGLAGQTLRLLNSSQLVDSLGASGRRMMRDESINSLEHYGSLYRQCVTRVA